MENGERIVDFDLYYKKKKSTGMKLKLKALDRMISESALPCSAL